MAAMQQTHPTFRCPHLKYHDRHSGGITAAQYDVEDPAFQPSFHFHNTMAASATTAANVPEPGRRRSLETGTRPSREVRQCPLIETLLFNSLVRICDAIVLSISLAITGLAVIAPPFSFFARCVGTPKSTEISTWT